MADDTRQRPSSRNRRALLRLVVDQGRLITAALAALTALTALAPVGLSIAIGALVGSVASGSHSGTLTAPLLAFALLFAVISTTGPVLGALTTIMGRAVHGQVFVRSLRATHRPATVAHHEDPALLDLVFRAGGVPPFGPMTAVRGLVSLWTGRIAAGASLVVVAAFSPFFAFGLAAAMVVTAMSCRSVHFRLMAIVARNRSTRGTASDGTKDSLRRADYLRTVAISAGAAKEIRLFGLAGWIVVEFRRSWLAAMRPVWRERRGMGTRVALALAPLLVAQALTIVAIARAGQVGSIGVGVVVVYIQAVIGCAALVASHDDQYRFEFGTGTVGAMLELEAAVDREPRLQVEGSRPAAGMPRHEICFDGVTFAYPGVRIPVLDGFDLVLPFGTSLGVVGVNGAGKTTLVKLLARLYAPDGGTVSVDGIPLADLDAQEWQRQIAGVFQDFVRYPLSLRDNVALGREVDDAVVASALATSGADRVAARLAAGWDTVLSPRYSGGVDLSGGEWQRVALARALVAIESGARVLILDEPTAQLDARGEADFYDRFLDVTRGVTSIVISHRFSSVRQANAIAVIDGGRIVEHGSHADLVSFGGLYAANFRLQAERFR